MDYSASLSPGDSLVQHAAYVERAFSFPIEQDVRARGILQIAIAHATDTPGFVTARERLHRRDKFVVILVGLLQPPILERIASAILKIRLPPAA